MIRVKRFVVGPVMTNCYVVADPDSSDCLVIDPGFDAEGVLKWIKGEGLKVSLILNTHGHFDHVASNGLIKEGTGAKLAIHRDDLQILRSAPSLAMLFGLYMKPSPEPDLLLREGDVVRVGRFELKVIHTPGHTPGSISLLGEGMIFSGDTLFQGSIGRTDLPGGSFELLIETIKTKLLTLPDETVVHPGHGEPTTIGEERRWGVGGWVF